MSRERETGPNKFYAGRVCLDFANTLNWRHTASPVELIPSYKDFISWSEQRGTITRPAAAKLLDKAEANEAEANATMELVHRLRANLIEIADVLNSRQRPGTVFLNQMLRDLPPQPMLVEQNGKLLFDLDGSALKQPVWPVVWSASEVLVSKDAERIGSCRADGCGWFFVDESPNHTRMWCNDGCGNRERVRRSYSKRTHLTKIPV